MLNIVLEYGFYSIITVGGVVMYVLTVLSCEGAREKFSFSSSSLQGKEVIA